MEPSRIRTNAWADFNKLVLLLTTATVLALSACDKANVLNAYQLLFKSFKAFLDFLPVKDSEREYKFSSKRAEPH